MPPTRIISLISPALSPASLSACLHGSIDLSIKSDTSDSNLDLDSFIFKCLGPEESAVINGRFTSV